uniref:guanylate kinase n=1 Tax=Romanomermis culicivorax TaxID=13658 RepID=A0A915JDX8_ROMCU
MVKNLRNASSITKILESATSSMFKPVVISGPSGGGKSTLLKKLFDAYSNAFAFCVSHTTRKPRPGEVNGKDYYFVDRDTMLKSIENNEFLEYAEFGGNLYGTSKKAVQDIQSFGKICILDVELQGVRSIKKANIEARYVYIKPPSVAELEKRLRSRGTETEDSVSKRLNQARIDMEAIEKEPTLFDYVVVNDNLDDAYKELHNIFEKDLYH